MNPINPQQLHEHSADRRREVGAAIAAERSRRAARAVTAPQVPHRLGPLFQRLFQRAVAETPGPVPAMSTEVRP